MTSFPVAERELRVAARKRSTYALRLTAAIMAFVIGGTYFVLTQVVGARAATAEVGKGLFAVLTWLGLAASLSAGLFLTSDCLSEEKREGTLGFLFLTDLRGYDVVLGKLLATSMRAICGLLAMAPILATTLVMGGVSGAAFWKTLWALVNAMFMSLAVGLLVSALSRDSQKALATTLLALILLVAAGPVIDRVRAGIQRRAYQPELSLVSPGYLFVAAGGWRQTSFWKAALLNQVVGWGVFGLVAVVLPHTWQESPSPRVRPTAAWAYAWRYGRSRARGALRRKLIDPNPVLWLACRERWQAVLLWVVTLLMVGTFALMLALAEDWTMWFAWSYLAGALTLFFYLGTASQAGQFFLEVRRTGLIELLLATPVTPRQVIRGQWAALGRRFGVPLTLCLAVQLLGAFMVQQNVWRNMAAATVAMPPPTPPTTTNATGVAAPVVTHRTTIVAGQRVTSGVAITNRVPGSMVSQTPSPTTAELWVALAIAFAGLVGVAANLTAIGWFGMWMGLTSRSANVATLRTIWYVQILPWFLISSAALVIAPLLLFKSGVPWSANPFRWLPLASTAFSTALGLVKDTAFVLWARRKLYSEFRQRASLGGRAEPRLSSSARAQLARA